MFWKRMTIDDLVVEEPPELRSLRARIPILIIDDEEFVYIDVIRNHGYNPKHVTGIEDIYFVKAYEVILCDIKGVGKTFGSSFEGAHIINEIRKTYPHKIIIGYTGQQFDADYNKFFSMCDSMVKKDIDSDEWIEKLDDAILKSIDPISQWKKIHMTLCDRNVPTKVISEIEHNFVKSKKNKREKFPSNKVMSMVNDHIKTILLNLSSSAIFNLISLPL